MEQNITGLEVVVKFINLGIEVDDFMAESESKVGGDRGVGIGAVSGLGDTTMSQG